jgi:uncharacterized protein
METQLQEARERLHSRLRMEQSMLVAFSGGVDSAYLAWEAYQILGEKMLAVIADSPSLPRKHLAAAIAFAQEHGIPLRTPRRCSARSMSATTPIDASIARTSSSL